MARQVACESVLVQRRDDGVALSNEVMDHKSAVDMALWLQSKAEPKASEPAPSHDHSHAEEHSHAAEAHDHSHAEKKDSHAAEAHEHGHAAEAATCDEPACTDPSHDHSHAEAHEHSHSDAAACDEPGCTDPTHDHSHAETCTDPTHDHSHADASGLQATTAATRFGIGSFVYSRRRPFAEKRLRALLAHLPLVTEAALPAQRLEHGGDLAADPSRTAPFAPVLRSKGFMWVAPESNVAYYWSHAGKHLEVSELGRWWAAVPREDWPEAHHASILEDFDEEGGQGDRRQELVFIGAGLDEAAITEALDACLLTDEEQAASSAKK